MKFSSLSMIAVFGTLSALTSVPAHADESHPCHEYIKHCKSKDLTPGHGLWKCVGHEAKKSGNEACIAKLKEGAEKKKEQKVEATEKAPE